MADYNLYELLAINIAKTFNDEEVGFTGLVTGEKAALFGSLVPLAAMSFAQYTHAPNLTIFLAGSLFNPDLSQINTIPDSECDPWLAYANCEGLMQSFPPEWSCDRGDIDCGFSSAAQIDIFGNMNTVCIGNYNNPKVRLVGPIFTTEHLTLFKREIIMMPHHEKRNFVEKVDYISSVGYPGGIKGREKLGLKRGGPMWVVTDKCIFDFDLESGKMKVFSIHPGIDEKEIIESTGFEILGLRDAIYTPEPTKEELPGFYVA